MGTSDIVPGGKYGTQKWSGGTGIDVFAPRGTPVNAPFDGQVFFQRTAPPGAPGPIGVAYLRRDDGFTIRITHVSQLANGRVKAGEPVATIDDPNLTPAFQHADLTISSSGNFPGPPPMGGDVDARTYLKQIGYQGQEIPGRTNGPMEMMRGLPPFNGGDANMVNGGNGVPSALQLPPMMGGMPGGMPPMMGGPGMGGMPPGMGGMPPGMGGMPPGMGGMPGGMGGMPPMMGGMPPMMGGMPGGMGGMPPMMGGMPGGMGGMPGGMGGMPPMMGGMPGGMSGIPPMMGGMPGGMGGMPPMGGGMMPPMMGGMGMFR